MTLIDKEWKAKQKFIGKTIRLYRGEFDSDQKFFTCMDVKCKGVPSGWFCEYIFSDDKYNDVLVWGKIRDIQILQVDMEKNERCPVCKLKEQIVRIKNPEYMSNDYNNVCVCFPADPTCDHNRKCMACGLMFRKQRGKTK